MDDLRRNWTQLVLNRTVYKRLVRTTCITRSLVLASDTRHKMKVLLISLVLASTLIAANAEAQFGDDYHYPFVQGRVRNYPAAALARPPGVPQNARLFFGATWVVTSSTISTSTIFSVCTYSTAAIAACPSGRRRRGLLQDEEEQFGVAIAPSSVER